MFRIENGKVSIEDSNQEGECFCGAGKEKRTIKLCGEKYEKNQDHG